MKRKVYIVDGKRTAIGKFLGSLSTVKPGDMAAQVMQALLEATGADPAGIQRGRVPPLPGAHSVRREFPTRFPPPRSICSAVAD